MKYIDIFLRRAMRILASPTFFRYIVGLLIFQAAWIALSSHYPMAFDEDFHLGIIRIYAQHLSPFLEGQPVGADTFGAVARDPSYLYHYVFSFPYRLINLCTQNLAAQVIILRFMNIGLFAVGLVLYRRLFEAVKAPTAVINGSLLLFVLIPVVPLLAAQINYDNLFIPAAAVSLLLAVGFTNRLRAGNFDVVALLWLAISCLLTSLVKYAYLPIFMAIGAYTLVQVVGFRRHNRADFWHQIKQTLARVSRLKLMGLILLTFLSLGLFSQRYVVNFAHYHTPIPSCNKVLTVGQCSAYGPWIRDYNYAINKVNEAHNPAVFTGDWLYGMWLRLYFAVDGPATRFQTRGPLPVPGMSIIVIGIGGMVALVGGLRKLLRNYDRTAIILFLTTATVYITTLWFDNYKAYVRTGQPVAINGRYLLPFMPLVLVLGALAGRQLLIKYPRLISFVTVTILLSQLWGGGVLTYILRSNDNWYWHSSVVRNANHLVQKTLGPVTPGYDEPTEFLR